MSSFLPFSSGEEEEEGNLVANNDGVVVSIPTTTTRTTSGERRKRKDRKKKNDLDVRNVMLERRRQESIQLRKQRKEERLQIRRATNNDNNNSSSSSTTTTGAETMTRRTNVLETIESFLMSGNVLALQYNLSSHVDKENLQNYPIQELEQAKTFLSRLYFTLMNNTNTLQQQQQQQQALAVYQVLLTITSSSVSFHTTRGTKSNDDDDDDYSYYGTVALRWSDLLLENDVWMNHLLQFLLDSIYHAHNDVVVTIIANILGNLVLDSGQTPTKIIWPLWNRLVPSIDTTTSYLCAALAQKDFTTLGCQFLQPIHGSQLVAWIQNNQTQVDAMWFLEGITRREEQAVQMLLSMTTTTTTTSSENSILLQAWKNVVMAQIHRQNNNLDFLFPAVKTIGNMAVAGHGIHITTLLVTFGDALNLILQQGQLLEAVRTVACFFLCDIIHPSSSSMAAFQVFVPTLIPIVLYGGTLEWKREAIVALDMAIMTDRPSHQLSDSPLVISTFLLWEMIGERKLAFLNALMDLSASPDSTASWSALRILDRILRTIPHSPSLLEQNVMGAVDRLQDMANQANLEERAEIALDLLEDFFETNSCDNEDEGNVPDGAFGNDHSVMSALPERTFSFGFGPTQQLQQHEPPGIGQNSPPPVMIGRGRGRPIPSWMS